MDAFDVVGFGDVAGDADHAAARIAAGSRRTAAGDRLDRLVERGFAAGTNRDVAAGRDELRGDGKAETLAAAGDDGRTALQRNFHLKSSQFSCWRRTFCGSLFRARHFGLVKIRAEADHALPAEI